MQNIKSVKSGSTIIIVGVVMVISGLITFYSIQSSYNLAPLLREIKHAGTFVGLMGFGVIMAGILLYLMNRNQPTLQEDYDAEMDIWVKF